MKYMIDTLKILSAIVFIFLSSVVLLISVPMGFVGRMFKGGYRYGTEQYERFCDWFKED